MNLKLFGMLTAVALLASLAVACSDDDDAPSAEEARTQFCSDLDELRVQVENLRALTDESTVGDLRAARDDVQAALEDVQTSAEDIAEAELSAAEDAYDDLAAAVDDLDEDQSLAAALEDIAPTLIAFDEAWDEIFLVSRCHERPGFTPTGALATAIAATAAAGGGEPTAPPPADTPVPGTTPTGELATIVAATAAADAALTATVEAAIPEVKTAIVGTAVAQTAVAATAVAEAGAAQTATIEAAIPEVKTAIVGTAIAAATQTAEAIPPTEPPPTETPVPEVNPQ